MKTKLISAARVHSFVRSALGDDLHAKRVLSLGNAALGTLTGAALAIYAIELGLAKATSTQTKARRKTGRQAPEQSGRQGLGTI
jgi:hypothetical protein